MMNAHIKSIILEHTGASGIFSMETIQELWSGYGKIMRVGLKNASRPSVVVKHVQFPSAKMHPRGWNTQFA
ncbi:MAG: choline kinase, partial [Saprospiraceae bacterium]|nr:choline kinase [Saprospiraceae bacterium]